MKNKPEWYWTWVRVQDGEVMTVKELYSVDCMLNTEWYDGRPSRDGGIWVWLGVSCVSEAWTVWTNIQEYRDAYAASK